MATSENQESPPDPVQDATTARTNPKKTATIFLPWLVILAHLAIALAGAYYLACGNIFGLLNISGTEFFRQFLITGVFLYALCFSFRYLGFSRANPLRLVTGIMALSLAVSLLLAADAYRPAEQCPRVSSDRSVTTSAETPPESLSALFYTLLTKHQALLALSILTLAGVILGTYYIFRSLFAVEYSGSGLQIRLPGHQVVYLPIYPQISWQNTEIVLREGEDVSIDLYGYVSPGALLTVPEVLKYKKDYDEWAQKGRNPKEWDDLVQSRDPTWPYTTPRGYPVEWYGPDNKLPVLARHILYEKDYYYREDTGLTVKGLPHNVVVGLVKAAGEPPPREAVGKDEAYDWSKKDDKDELLLLSSDKYPITISVKKTGELYVVINDVDEARWDNAGMFFLKVTRHAWL